MKAIGNKFAKVTAASLIIAGGVGIGAATMAAPPAPAISPVQEGERAAAQSQSEDKSDQVVLMEGDRTTPKDAMIFVKSSLIEEGEAVKQMAENEANLNNVRFNINDYLIGYSVATEKAGDRTVFSGPTKAWRAKSMGDVSRWPPVLYNAARKETIRQSKAIYPMAVEEMDESNNLRLYYRPLVVGHEDGKYVDEPTALALFVHPKTGTRVTSVFRDGRLFASIGEPLPVAAQVYVKEVVPGRRESSRLVPSVFYSKTVKIEADPLESSAELAEAFETVLNTKPDRPLDAQTVKTLFKELARLSGGETEPVAKVNPARQ